MDHGLRNKVWALGASLSISILSGCTGGDGSNLNLLEEDETLAQNALSDPYGYLGTSDEGAAFGDSEISDLDDEEAAYSDAYASSFTSALMVNAQTGDQENCDIYFIRARWGQLKGFNTDSGTPADWSGQISANVGTLAVISTLAFDKEDSVTDRTDPKVVSFVSKTLPHFDGLRLKYQVCESDKTSLGVDELPTVSFSSPSVPFSATYTSEQLKLLSSLIEDVDANGNRFQIHATIKSDLCQGTLEGHWTLVTAKRGVFRGRVIAQNGVHLGHVKGVFGEKIDGEKSWAGKFISKRGRFKGILVGEYGEGNFEGTVKNRAQEDIGQVSGQYVSNEVRKRGTFAANYTLNCADVPSENE